jgi:hypothetical protein
MNEPTSRGMRLLGTWTLFLLLFLFAFVHSGINVVGAQWQRVSDGQVIPPNRFPQPLRCRLLAPDMIHFLPADDGMEMQAFQLPHLSEYHPPRAHLLFFPADVSRK